MLSLNFWRRRLYESPKHAEPPSHDGSEILHIHDGALGVLGASIPRVDALQQAVPGVIAQDAKLALRLCVRCELPLGFEHGLPCV